MSFKSFFDKIKPVKAARAIPGAERNFIVNEYAPALANAITAHEGKLQAIYEARLMTKQKLPDSLDEKTHGAVMLGGNNSSVVENRSKYLHPIVRAISLKIMSDMTSYPAAFEYDTTLADEDVHKLVFEMEMLIAKHLSTRRNVQQLTLALHHYIESGTIIAEPQLIVEADGYYDENGTKKDEPRQYALSFNVYDPLTVLIDPNASPCVVPDTAEYIIITLGYWSAERIKSEFDVNIEKKDGRVLMSGGGLIHNVTDVYMRDLQEVSGSVPRSDTYIVRKYIRASDGMEYYVVDDGFVVKKQINGCRVHGRLPIAWCPIMIDTNSPYGIPLAEEMKPSVHVISTIFNQVCDINAENVNSPIFTFKDLIDKTQLTMNSGKRNEIVELTPGAFLGHERFEFDINKLVKRITFPALDDDSLFIYREAMNAIWFLTGLNPTALSGYQDKQVRVSGVAEMLQTASMRNTSVLVKNYETMFLNPIASQFHWFIANNYEKFPEFKKHGIVPEIMKKIYDIRVVNGSYLPGDQSTRLQKAAMLRQEAAQNRTIDPVRALRYFYQQFGIDLRRFERDPLELLTEDQVIQMHEIIRSGNTQGLIQYIEETAKAIAGKSGGTNG